MFSRALRAAAVIAADSRALRVHCGATLYLHRAGVAADWSTSPDRRVAVVPASRVPSPEGDR